MSADRGLMQQWGNGGGSAHVPRWSLQGAESPFKSFRVTARKMPRRALLTVEAPLLGLLLIIFAVSAIVTPAMQVAPLGFDLSNIVVCPFLWATGVPCLFCGITRSFLSMGHGEVWQSFVFHPLGPAIYGGLAALALGLALSLAGGWQLRLRLAPAARLMALRWGALIVLLAWGLKIVLWNNAGLI